MELDGRAESHHPSSATLAGTVVGSVLRKGRIVCLDTLGDRVGALAEARIFADQVGPFAPTGSTV